MLQLHLSKLVDVDCIAQNPYQPRKMFHSDSIAELAASIKEMGLIQYPVVRYDAAGACLLIAGERRLRAVKLLGWAQVPVIVSDLTEEAAAAAAVLENMQREDVNVLEEAQGIQTMIERLGMSQAQIAASLGVSQAKVSQKLILLQLSPTLKANLLEGRINQSIGRILAQLPIPVQEQLEPSIENLTAKIAQSIVNVYKGFVILRDQDVYRNDRIASGELSINNRCFLAVLKAGLVDIGRTAQTFVLKFGEEGKIGLQNIPPFEFPLSILDLTYKAGDFDLVELVVTYKLAGEYDGEEWADLVLNEGAGVDASAVLYPLLAADMQKGQDKRLNEYTRVRERLAFKQKNAADLAVKFGNTEKGRAFQDAADEMAAFLEEETDSLPESLAKLDELMHTAQYCLDNYNDAYDMEAPMCVDCHRVIKEEPIPCVSGRREPIHSECLRLREEREQKQLEQSRETRLQKADNLMGRNKQKLIHRVEDTYAAAWDKANKVRTDNPDLWKACLDLYHAGKSLLDRQHVITVKEFIADFKVIMDLRKQARDYYFISNGPLWVIPKMELKKALAVYCSITTDEGMMPFPENDCDQWVLVHNDEGIRVFRKLDFDQKLFPDSVWFMTYQVELQEILPLDSPIDDERSPGIEVKLQLQVPLPLAIQARLEMFIEQSADWESAEEYIRALIIADIKNRI